MRAVAISDNDIICTGFRLAGMECHTVETSEAFAEALQLSIQPEIGLIVITSALAAKCRNVLEAFKKCDMPLIVEIPEGAMS